MSALGTDSAIRRRHRRHSLLFDVQIKPKDPPSFAGRTSDDHMYRMFETLVPRHTIIHFSLVTHTHLHYSCIYMSL